MRQPIRSDRPRRRDSGRWAVYGLATLLTVGVAAPLVAVLMRAVTGYGDEPSALTELAEVRNLEVLGNTVLLSVMVVVFATLMAAPLAFVMSWTRMREHRWIDILVLVPFLTPPYVSALAWLDFTRVNGLADQWLGPGGPLLRQVVESPVGMALIMAGEVFAFLYLILRNHFDSMPGSLDEMAAVSGASAWQRLRLIVMPLTTATYSMGALIVFIRAAGEFGTPVTLGNRIGFPVLVSEIYQSVTIDPLSFPTAAALSSLLLGLGMTVWVVQQWVSRSPRSFGGRTSKQRTVDLGRWTALGWCWLAVIALFHIVVPFIAIVIGSMLILRSAPPTPDNLTFDYYGQVLGSASAMSALQTSVVLAFIAASLATMLGVACAMVIARYRTPGTRAVDLMAVGPDTVPTIVLAIGLIFLWNAAWLPASPYNTQAMIVLGYTVVLLPLAVQNVKAARNGINDRLFEAAWTSGATHTQTFRRVTLPLLLPGMVAGWLLAFLLGVREVVVSSLLRPASLDLLSPWILAKFDQGHRSEAMAMTMIGVVSSTLFLLVIETWRRRRLARRTA